MRQWRDELPDDLTHTLQDQNGARDPGQVQAQADEEQVGQDHGDPLGDLNGSETQKESAKATCYESHQSVTANTTQLPDEHLQAIGPATTTCVLPSGNGQTTTHGQAVGR